MYALLLRNVVLKTDERVPEGRGDNLLRWQSTKKIKQA